MGRQTFFFPRSISDMCPRSMPNRCAISTGDHFFRSRSFRILWPNRVSRDDTLWIVTVRNYRLKLLGHIVADKIVGQRAAERRFRENYTKLSSMSLRGKETSRSCMKSIFTDLLPDFALNPRTTGLDWVPVGTSMENNCNP